jgi:hypothetical protein
MGGWVCDTIYTPNSYLVQLQSQTLTQEIRGHISGNLVKEYAQAEGVLVKLGWQIFLGKMECQKQRNTVRKFCVFREALCRLCTGQKCD